MQIPVGLLSYRELQCPSSGLDMSSYYAKTTFHRINVTSWFINGGRRTVSFYSSKVGASISPFLQEKAVCHGNYWNNPRNPYRSLGKGYRVPAAVTARHEDAVRTEDVSRWRVMMSSIEVPAST